MTFHWEYIACRIFPFEEEVIKRSTRRFLTRADCVRHGLRNQPAKLFNYNIILIIIKERDDGLTSPLSNYAARLETFQTWPPSIAVTASSLASAGFFYEGIGDKVTCYSCGKSLMRWQPTDNPWQEHRRHFPQCAHLNGPAASFMNYRMPRNIGESLDTCGPHEDKASSNGHIHGTYEVCDGDQPSNTHNKQSEE